MSWVDAQNTNTSPSTSGAQLSLTVSPTFGPPVTASGDTIGKQVIIGVLVAVVGAVAVAWLKRKG